MNNKIFAAKVNQQRAKQTPKEVREENNFMGAIILSVLLSICFFSECSKLKFKNLRAITKYTTSMTTKI